MSPKSGRTPSGATANRALVALRTQVDAFVECYVPDLNCVERSSAKVVHDGLWRTLRLGRSEVGILDTPLLQRLRQVHQTGCSYLTFPSTTHTRFEHVLGVMLQVKELGEALQKSNETRISSDDLNHMRVAALLHDVGHGPFSHTSETIFGDSEVFRAFEREYPSAKPHEALAHIIVTSKRFGGYLKAVFDINKETPPDIDEIASYIVGDCNKRGRPYKGELLNGPFDADKLDYLFRDSHFSGLPLTADLDRLWYTVRIARVAGKERLVVTQSGATALEQVFFSKMVLSATVYQHHKVRACDCMFAGIIEYMQDKGISMKVRDHTLSFRNPADFLWVTDGEFLSLGFETDDSHLHTLIHNLFFRRLLKRALVISRRTIEDGSSDNIEKLLELSKTGPGYTKKRRALAKEIWKRAKVDCLPHEVFLDLPARPSFGAADSTYIFHSDPPEDQGVEPITLNDLLKVGLWTKQYGQHRWRGHVFCPAHLREEVGRAARSVLEEAFEIKFRPEAFLWCKLRNPS